jgi:hypothetical protein
MSGPRLLHLSLPLALLISILAPFTRAQDSPSPSEKKPVETNSPAPAHLPIAPKMKTEAAATHAFWDKRNAWLFAGVGASRALDYASTLNMRRRGVNEILLNNDVVDNHAAFAAIEAAGTGLSISASYLFHCYGHHRLERWTSVVHISFATGGAIRNYSLKTVPKPPANP